MPARALCLSTGLQGAFVVSISKSAPILKFVPLLTVKDTNSTSLTLYTESVKIPE